MNTTQPTLRSANWLYLTTMGLILLLGSFMQARSMSWGLLATEFGLILLPTLVFIWRGRLAPRAVLRLRWPGWRLVLLGALIGAGVWGLDIGLQGLAAAVLGYTPASGLSSLAADPLNLTVFVFAMVVGAPLCEEALFRGYLLSAYSRYRPAVRLVVVGLLFACYHLQFEGLVALLPIALVLGLLAHRSQSLAPGIAAHMANNSFGALVAVARALNPTIVSSQTFTVLLCSLMVVGPLVAVAALAVYLRLTRTPRVAGETPAPVATPALGRGAWWPLAGAAVIYVALAGLEVVTGRFPQVLAQRTLQLQPAPWTAPLHLAYRLFNVENKQVGEAACALMPQAGAVAFDCTTTQQHFEAHQGNSMWAGGTYTFTQTGRWDAATMRLLEADLDFEGEFNRWTAQVRPSADPAQALSLALNGAAPTTLPADAVLAAEWPFRLMALPLGGSGYFGSNFNQVLIGVGQETGVVEAATALIAGQEELPTPPTGSAAAWKVQVGQQTAWYTVAAPHLLLRYDDGFGVTWTVDTDSLPDYGN